MKTITVKLKDSYEKHFRFSGIASSESKDYHGEIIKQRGIDLSLVKRGKAIINAEHGDTIIGRIEHAEIKNGKLYVEGIVYIRSIKAKQFYDLLKNNDPSKPVELSIEFVNPQYSSKNKSTLTGVVLTGVALVGLKDEPANKDTYAKLLKSVSKAQLLAELLRRSEHSSEFRLRLEKILMRTKKP